MNICQYFKQWAFRNYIRMVLVIGMRFEAEELDVVISKEENLNK